jgi:hypothetical protein
LVRRLAIASLAAFALIAPSGAAAEGLKAVPEPMQLPGEATVAGADPGTWMVGARPSAATRAIARRFGARRIGPGGDHVVARGRARAFARALGAALVYAHPNGLAATRQAPAVPDDPLSVSPNDWRAVVAHPSLAPPPVTDTSPLIALVDTRADETHPEWAGGHFATLAGRPVENLHGTATAAVAAAPANGTGILGVWPGARALNVPLPPRRISCADSARGVHAAIDAGAAVINMSYGSRSLCRAEYTALQRAVRRGIVPVAAAGNEFSAGNPPEFPASLPHVLTVAAVDGRGLSSAFSNANRAVDLSAPGERILTAVPAALDEDETKDGYQALDGTSLSAPMVSAAVAWVRAARPDLTPDQASQIVRLSARDIGPEGYDEDTGFGLLDVGAALSRQPPPADPLEPNDDMTWVNGRSFGRPSPAVFRGRGAVRFSALLDVTEDPADVYRVRIPGRSRVRAIARPVFGDLVLAGFAPGTRSVGRRPLDVSRRRGGRTERITLRNRSRRARTFFVALGVQRGARSLDAGYRLTIRRP